MDLEGSDSKERWNDKLNFDNKLGLFGLILSNLLMINIWISDVGRFQGSNYNILKVTLELNISLFNSD